LFKYSLGTHKLSGQFSLVGATAESGFAVYACSEHQNIMNKIGPFWGVVIKNPIDFY
jgi:hypothetical protein